MADREPSAVKPDLASAMYPNLSREARQRQASEAKAQAAQQTRLERTAANLQAVIDAWHRERG